MIRSSCVTWMTWLTQDQTSDSEHMKASLFLTDVVVLRNEVDTVNILGLEITQTSTGFKVRHSTELVESLLNLYGLEHSKPAANPCRRSTVMELATAILLDGHDHSNFGTAVGKRIFLAPWRPDMQFAIQQLSTQVLNPTTESNAPHMTVQQGMIEFVGCGDSHWARDSASRQSVTGYHCNLQGVTMCNRSLKLTAISFISCEAELVLRSQSGRTVPRSSLPSLLFVSKWIQIRHVTVSP